LSGFNNLCKILAGQSGNLLEKNEIANTLNMSSKTVNRYLDILQYTFVIILLNPFFNNIRSRLTKTVKIYFYDLGIRNALLNNFNNVEFRRDNGALFENFVYLELLNRYGAENIFFYRSQQKAEVDFIVESKKLALEVKYKKFKDKKIFKVFENFKGYKNFVVNLNYNLKLPNYEYMNWWKFINN
jgi:hypothetical protein